MHTRSSRGVLIAADRCGLDFDGYGEANLDQANLDQLRSH